MKLSEKLDLYFEVNKTLYENRKLREKETREVKSKAGRLEQALPNIQPVGPGIPRTASNNTYSGRLNRIN